jgi:hypothetical protein
MQAIADANARGRRTKLRCVFEHGAGRKGQPRGDVGDASTKALQEEIDLHACSPAVFQALADADDHPWGDPHFFCEHGR